MEAALYFESYKKYFWQWEDDAEVLAIPHGDTIAYRQLIIDILRRMAPQGLPPFGSLLLAIIATNTNGSNTIDSIFKMIAPHLEGTSTSGDLYDAVGFLKLLSEAPRMYKEGNRRILFLCAIFERAHNSVSAKVSKSILNSLINLRMPQKENILTKKELTIQKAAHDIRVLALLARKFRDLNDIIERIASLPELADEPFVFEEEVSGENADKDLVTLLIDNNKTFQVGSLIKRIWSGLNIPFHSALPSQQPLGGVSDLTNKGELDKLLISEFANDDIVFLSRLANNEALYIHREIPPVNNNLQRVFLVDAGLKNWGTPRLIAFAVMIAIARHPKTDIACIAYAIGNDHIPISLDSIHSIIDALQILQGGLHPGHGLAAYFKEYPDNANREVFLLTEPTTLKEPEMLRILQTHNKQIDYWVHPDALGNIEIFKRQQNSKRHIQHMHLPLEELWAKKDIVPQPVREDVTTYFPILFRGSTGVKMIGSTSDGAVFQVSSEKMVLKLHDPAAGTKKGWELVYEKLPFIAGEFEIGLLNDGSYLLLMYNPQARTIILLNITSGKKHSFLFKDWKSRTSDFAFYDGLFYYRTYDKLWSIDKDGTIENVTVQSKTDLFQDRKIDAANNKQAYSVSKSVFRNVTKVYVNARENLVFNSHELITEQGHFKLQTTGHNLALVKAECVKPGEFVFPDGSSVSVHRGGMLILKSSYKAQEDIFITSLIDTPLGVATNTEFSGNEVYNRSLPTISTFLFHNRHIKKFISEIISNSTTK